MKCFGVRLVSVCVSAFQDLMLEQVVCIYKQKKRLLWYGPMWNNNDDVNSCKQTNERAVERMCVCMCEWESALLCCYCLCRCQCKIYCVRAFVLLSLSHDIYPKPHSHTHHSVLTLRVGLVCVRSVCMYAGLTLFSHSFGPPFLMLWVLYFGTVYCE